MKQRFCFQKAHIKISRALRPRSEQKFERILGQTDLLLLENIPERQEAVDSPWEYRCWQEPFLGARSTMTTLVLRDSTWESSL